MICLRAKDPNFWNQDFKSVVIQPSPDKITSKASQKSKKE